MSAVAWKYQSGALLHFVGCPNKFSWGCKFVDIVLVVVDLQFVQFALEMTWPFFIKNAMSSPNFLHKLYHRMDTIVSIRENETARKLIW